MFTYLLSEGLSGPNTRVSHSSLDHQTFFAMKCLGLNKDCKLSGSATNKKCRSKANISEITEPTNTTVQYGARCLLFIQVPLHCI